MSAAVCGSKRSFFEDIPSPSPVSKKLRCYSSPISPPTLIDRLRDRFPHIETQHLVTVLENCGNDLDAAILSLNEICLGSASRNSTATEESDGNVEQGTLTENQDASVSESLSAPCHFSDASAPENPSARSNIPENGAEWVELFVREMSSATSIEDAKVRASRVLGILEKSISAHVSSEAIHSFQKENMMLKEQIEVVIRENTILKRAVAIQHERQKEQEDKNRELQHLKQLVTQYQEQLRNLEVNNYALAMHLKQAQESNPFPGRFHPDVF